MCGIADTSGRFSTFGDLTIGLTLYKIGILSYNLGNFFAKKKKFAILRKWSNEMKDLAFYY